MPITYQGFNINASSSTPAIPDADSSIVLSDLLRSGETSRLRRRGAVRLDHMPRNDDTRGSVNGTSGSLEEEECCFRLYCRECDAPSDIPFIRGSTAYQPSLFPSASSFPQNPKGKERAYAPQCQERTLIHPRVKAQRLPHIDASLHVHPPSTSLYPPTSAQVLAFLQRSQRPNYITHSSGTGPRPDVDARDSDNENGILVWTSVSNPVDSVLVPMHYEDDSTEATAENDTRFMTVEELATRRPGPISTACLCKREVIGCAVCGSPLGMRYTPCSSAVKKIFPSPAQLPSPSLNSHPRTFLARRSDSIRNYPRPTTINSNPETSNYRSRVADYLLAAMHTPRSGNTTSAHTVPSPPEPIRITPETNHDLDHGRPFQVSIFPRRARPQNTQNHDSSTTSRDQEPSDESSVSGSSARPVVILDRHDDNAEAGERSPLAELHPSRVAPLSDTESVTDTETDDDSDNDDHYRLPMITQSGSQGRGGDQSGCVPGHWELEKPTRFVYRFFAEAVIAEPLKERDSPSAEEGGEEVGGEGGGFSSSAADWSRFYAAVHGLNLGRASEKSDLDGENDTPTRNGEEEVGSSCG
ncbi:hypothetical protein GYMLUDRAFT_84982 [Collybiopsis luxurians FD-317 M1]|uniref:Uncharacterized protein n=1 Tax=Collybiopsis luxurians FD-317 M1 TaxID=944289 RepID=A0A0D0CFQ5_9AGAR|nr:hypothetical protein GYMLUDRAFT_84982 [Collybiopsis luxurians FD-317 M1]